MVVGDRSLIDERYGALGDVAGVALLSLAANVAELLAILL